MESGSENLTVLLNAAAEGDSRAAAELLPVVYEELRSLAHRFMSREPGRGSGQTLQATALVHEAYMRLVKETEVRWDGRGHFYGAAAIAMRRILVEGARARRGPKRGGDRARVDLPEDLSLTLGGEDLVDWEGLDAALAELERADARLSEIVMLRFFAGLSFDQTGTVMGLSGRQVKRDWSVARAWLFRRMAGAAPAGGAAGATGPGGARP